MYAVVYRFRASLRCRVLCVLKIKGRSARVCVVVSNTFCDGCCNFAEDGGFNFKNIIFRCVTFERWSIYSHGNLIGFEFLENSSRMGFIILQIEIYIECRLHTSTISEFTIRIAVNDLGLINSFIIRYHAVVPSCSLMLFIISFHLYYKFMNFFVHNVPR